MKMPAIAFLVLAVAISPAAAQDFKVPKKYESQFMGQVMSLSLAQQCAAYVKTPGILDEMRASLLRFAGKVKWQAPQAKVNKLMADSKAKVNGPIGLETPASCSDLLRDLRKSNGKKG
ncbi:hypothetical protein [Mesorhizobium sp. 1M-11]|uniref:hypothetical protein n=1 Tax=Mesorhizobium sp. 1M-11 TaxID=1529006 RepID=UPI0006C74B8B|nr:hypothetical protein [Mesorhizobium sp. 1M-11]